MMIDLISGGGNVEVTQLRAGQTPVGLLRAGNELTVRVPNGGLVDKNGPALNLESGGDANLDGQFFGTAEDALEVAIGGKVLRDDDGLFPPIRATRAASS